MFCLHKVTMSNFLKWRQSCEYKCKLCSKIMHSWPDLGDHVQSKHNITPDEYRSAILVYKLLVLTAQLQTNIKRIIRLWSRLPLEDWLPRYFFNHSKHETDFLLIVFSDAFGFKITILLFLLGNSVENSTEQKNFHASTKLTLNEQV